MDNDIGSLIVTSYNERNRPMRIKVNVKHISKRKNTIEEVYYMLSRTPDTVAALIEEIVTCCVNEYNSNWENREVLKVFSIEEITDKASSGKVSFDKNYGQGKQNLKVAIENAKQSFLDGIVVIFIDETEMMYLDEQIKVTKESSVTFIRMTLLSGRLW